MRCEALGELPAEGDEELDGKQLRVSAVVQPWAVSVSHVSKAATRATHMGPPLCPCQYLLLV
jgi:hypothetical protein